MARQPTNHGQDWSKNDEAKLRELVRQNTPTRVIALKLQRTPGAVQQHASQEGVSLKPTNQRPYNRRNR